MNIPNTKNVFICAALLAVGGFSLHATVLSDKEEPQHQAPAQQRPVSMTVEVAYPEQATWPVRLSLDGELAAWEEVSVSAEIGGLRVDALYANVGHRVRKGQLLAELNNDTIEAALQEAEAQLAAAKVRLLETRTNLKRVDAVRDTGALSAQQIEQYEIAEKSAVASVAAAEAAVASAKARLNQTRFFAPVDGVIASRSTLQGSVVANGSELFRIVRAGRIEWRAEATASQLAQLRKGQGAVVALPGGAVLTGHVRDLSPALDPVTRTGIVYVDLDADPRARPGMYVKGIIELGNREALTLPSSAVTLRDGRSYVYVVDPDEEMVRQQEVVIGRVHEDRIEILSGLSPDAPVVRSGGAFLTDGDHVRIEK